jgi:FkbM family methyltransferase
MIASLAARILNKLKLVRRNSRRDLIPVHKINFSCRIKINGQVFKIPVINKTGWELLFMTGGWFTDVIRYLKADHSWTMIDVGANIGQTLLKIRSISREIQYFGFEPNPVCAGYLDKLIENNKFSRTVVFPAGLFDRNELMLLNHYTDSDTDSAASVIPEYRPETSRFRTSFVPVFEISKIPGFADLERIDLIKIDVEGAELEVLNTLHELIIKHKPFIIIEILPVYSGDNVIRKNRLDRIQRFIRETGYIIYLIGKGKNERFEYFRLKESLEIHGEIKDIDYLLAPHALN